MCSAAGTHTHEEPLSLWCWGSCWRDAQQSSCTCAGCAFTGFSCTDSCYELVQAVHKSLRCMLQQIRVLNCTQSQLPRGRIRFEVCSLLLLLLSAFCVSSQAMH